MPLAATRTEEKPTHRIIIRDRIELTTETQPLIPQAQGTRPVDRVPIILMPEGNTHEEAERGQNTNGGYQSKEQRLASLKDHWPLFLLHVFETKSQEKHSPLPTEINFS